MSKETAHPSHPFVVELAIKLARNNQAALVDLKELLAKLRHKDFLQHIFDSRDGEIFAWVQSAMKNMNIGWNDQAAECLEEAINCRRPFALSYVSLALLLRTLAYILGKVPGKKARRIEVLREAGSQYKAEIAELGRRYKENREQLEQALAEEQ